MHELTDQENIDHILDLLRRCMFVSYYTETEQSNSCFTLLKRLVPRFLRQSDEERKGDVEEEDTMIRTKYISFSGYLNANSQLQIPSASRLPEAGVKFSKSRSKPILYVRFQAGVLELPELLIDDNTEALFRNLIALEQCRYKIPSVVTAFAKLMDNLIDNVEDVHIKGITKKKKKRFVYYCLIELSIN